MITHLVLFKLEPGHLLTDAAVRRAIGTTAEHPGHIDQIRGWLHGPNTARRAQAEHDYALVAQFDDAHGLERFLQHPHHKAGAEAWRAVATWSVVDLDMPP